MKLVTMLVLVCVSQIATAADFANYFNRPSSQANRDIVQSYQGANIVQVNFGGSVQACDENLHKLVSALDASQKIIIRVSPCDGHKNTRGIVYFF